MKKKRFVQIPKRMSAQMMEKVFADVIGEDDAAMLVSRIMSYFTSNPKKTTIHLKKMRCKVRKWGSGDYSIEEA